MRRLTLTTLLLAPLLACGTSDDGTATDTTTDASTVAASTETAGMTGTAGTTTAATTTAATSSPTTGPDDTSTTELSTTGPGDDTDTAGTTGEPAFCNGWQTAEGAPYLNFYTKDDVLLADGGTLPLECGGQGSFMFALYGEFGGFTPTSDIVDFAVTADVEGFNMNPEGHFYSADPVGYYVSCVQTDGGPTGFVPIFPFDNLDDLTALDGKPAIIQVVMYTDEGDITVDYAVTLSVQKDDSWGFCGG